MCTEAAEQDVSYALFKIDSRKRCRKLEEYGIIKEIYRYHKTKGGM